MDNQALNVVDAAKSGLLKQWIDALIPKALSFGLSVLLALLIWFIGSKIIRTVKKGFAKSCERHGVDVGVAGFLTKIISVICNVFLFVIILGLFGITASSLAAGVAGIGVTVGLALQGALSNFAGGCLILLLHPFKVGDYIVEHASSKEGSVKEISIIYTTLVTPDGKTVVVPNGALAAASITNVTALGKRRMDVSVGISYTSDLKKARDILLKIGEGCDRRIKEDECYTLVADLGESAVKLELRFWVKNEEFWPVRFEILEDIKDAFDKAGVVIPYNQLDVHLDGTLKKIKGND